MSKNEFEDDNLKKWLDEYHVHIPREKLQFRTPKWERLIRYLASPTQNPLDKFHETSFGLKLFRSIPLTGAVLVGVIQVISQL
ncbi:hypothetical protein HNQ35_000494 [Cerasibacillus quisquiliarum]|uniref:Uncharacterized protein n=1 Tax=Cerasibacillus quisquiliarum TaxID=227865 RepID=A0A511UWG6_9BACI|nr:hypothetical protein [Cerasibacillus quisquiliarum]MBB5145305.1 hypothetical protein [Cerasibacillus quisquiliarum]GEN29803.1 hypothetical protein CQU01_00410 [Cerasibacillus quisquiliarum]